MNRAAVEKIISAGEANRKFSLLLRHVRAGRSYVVTSYGNPVARPATRQERVAARARETLLEHLKKQPVVKVGRWSRDELYEDDR
jgi:prevent-host-death family protein